MKKAHAYIPDEMVQAFKEGWNEADNEMGTAGPSGYRTRKGLEKAMDWLIPRLELPNERPVAWVKPPES